MMLLGLILVTVAVWNIYRVVKSILDNPDANAWWAILWMTECFAWSAMFGIGWAICASQEL